MTEPPSHRLVGSLATCVTLVALAACGGASSTSADAGANAADAAAADAAATDAPPSAPDATPPDAAPPAACAQLAAEHARADEALERFLLEFWKADAQYLRAQVPGQDTAQYWVYAQAFDAVLDGVERTGGAHFGGMIAALAAGQEAHGWNTDYYDDENWLALALIRAYDLTGEAAYLARAQALFDDIKTHGWDTTCCGASPGGIWWNQAHAQKATASNGGPVITGARLAARTGHADDLAFAKQAYAYWLEHMVDPVTHQVADHITPDGAITRWKFTYNEGVMLGGALELYAATGETHYLDDAHAFAAFMRASETVATDLGPVLTDGDCGGDCQQFKGIGYRYLDQLERVAPDPATAAVLDASAEAAWTRARDPGTGHFGTDWSASVTPGAGATIMQMSSSLSALSLDALRCGAYPTPPPATRFEAEDGFLRHVGLEAQGGGFSGWGYLAGWNGDGQGVELRVSVAAAGHYRVTFHYAGDAGEAVRKVVLDGTVVSPALHLPATGGWSTYADVQATYAFPGGASRLLVTFDAASGSQSYTNLDYIEIVPAP
jgi:predicted alpha-1,6-mannanase (GH76 family)